MEHYSDGDWIKKVFNLKLRSNTKKETWTGCLRMLKCGAFPLWNGNAKSFSYFWLLCLKIESPSIFILHCFHWVISTTSIFPLDFMHGSDYQAHWKEIKSTTLIPILDNTFVMWGKKKKNLVSSYHGFMINLSCHWSLSVCVCVCVRWEHARRIEREQW